MSDSKSEYCNTGDLRKFNCRYCNKEVETIWKLKLYCDDICKRKFYAENKEKKQVQDRKECIESIKDKYYKGPLCYDTETDKIYFAKYCHKNILSKESVVGNKGTE